MTDRKDFDEGYVKKLREEAASWRTKCRELETQVNSAEIDKELSLQGLKADPSWVQVEEGQSVRDAVEALAAQHPHLQEERVVHDPAPELDYPTPKPTTPRPLRPSTPNSNSPKPYKANRITSGNISEIKKDPVARSKVRDLYRSLLKSNSNQPDY